jgi:HEAT repeat protein
MEELLELWKTANDPVKGALLSAITLIVSENPGCIGNHLDFIIAQISHKAPRVKWESSEIVGHASKAFPDKAMAAIPALLENMSNEGTVVRWSAAFALSEIVKNAPASRELLVPKIKEILGRETNNGVRSLFLNKALKAVEKEKHGQP